MINAYVKIEINPVKGIEQVRQSLQNKIVRKAITQAAKPILSTAKGNAPKDTGALKFSLATVLKTKENSVTGKIGARVKYTKIKGKLKRRPARYLHLVEKGTKFWHGHSFLKNSMNETTTIETIRKLIAEGIQQALTK